MRECKKHKMVIASWGGKSTPDQKRPNIGMRCTKCNFRVENEMSPPEFAEWKQRQKLHNSKEMNVHLLWHDFTKRFMLGQDTFNIEKYGDKAGFGDAVCKWAEKHPEVIVTGCDDSYFSSSDIILIPHQSIGLKKPVMLCHEEIPAGPYFMGTSVVIIPQCDNQQPFQFFLYPGHTEGLLRSLLKVKTEYKKVRHL